MTDASDATEPSEPTVGVRLIVAYDGAEFAGWAAQPKQRTVQGVLTEAIAALARHDVEVRAAGRTDSGVHADGQVAAFDTTRTTVDAAGWMLGVNQRLPNDVAVRAAELCEAGYTPRFDATDKTYRYLLLTGEPRHPLWRRRAWHVPQPLDLVAMREAAAKLVGEHDFCAFRAADDGRATTVRTMHRVEVRERFCEEDDVIAIEVRGSAFLKQMVRIVVGTLVEVGRTRRGAGWVDALLVPGAKRHDAGPTAPAHGLTLVSVSLGRVGALAASAPPTAG